MKRPTAWSYSAYALYSQCPLKYKLEKIDKLPQPENPAFVKGHAWHKKAENFLRGVEKTLPAELVKFELSFQQLKTLEPLVEQQWGFDAGWKPTEWFGKDTWFRSVADAAVLYPDNTAETIDHKTGKAYDTNEEQIETQALSVMCRYSEVKSVTARLWYLETGQEVVREFGVSQRDELKAKWAAKVGPMFADTRFAPRPNSRCRWCAFSKYAGGPCKVA